MALNIPFTQIARLMVLVSFHKHLHRSVRLMVLVSFHKHMQTQPCGTEFSFLSEECALWYWFVFIKICTPSPMALNFPFSKVVGLMVLVSFHKHMHRRVHLMVLVSFHKHMHRRLHLMVLVSFHKHMHTQPCGTEFSFL